MKVYNTYIGWQNCSAECEQLRKYIPEHTTSLDSIYDGLCRLVADFDIDDLFFKFGHYNNSSKKIKDKRIKILRDIQNGYPGVILMWREAPVEIDKIVTKVIVDGVKYTREDVEETVGDFIYKERSLFFNYNISITNVEEYSGKKYSLTDSVSKS